MDLLDFNKECLKLKIDMTDKNKFVLIFENKKAQQECKVKFNKISGVRYVFDENIFTTSIHRNSLLGHIDFSQRSEEVVVAPSQTKYVYIEFKLK